jgi:hypothetical protein
MLGKRDEGSEMVRPSLEADHLDGLARGVADGTISRGRAIKLAGAALVGSALTLFGASQEADAVTRRRCRRRYGNNGIVCTGGGRQVCCDDRTTTSRACSRGRCGPPCSTRPPGDPRCSPPNPNPDDDGGDGGDNN